ncbi:nucleotide sugar dehydrogenase [Helicobacter canis]|uniref:UDP-glucose/GDP-mannose dehydrogenase n=1 Tax=Helicobacter canis TaxID=29419 RepID=A0A377J257_9HELI|nr:nucleotide sugar dehydrogenase [Helicobacter canis]STO96385.1 UDP-glucose/GDP-mannose dehydrogenase [Helicobacter canis]
MSGNEQAPAAESTKTSEAVGDSRCFFSKSAQNKQSGASVSSQVSLEKPTPNKPSRRRKDFAMILGVFKAGAKGFTLSGNEQAHAAESLKSTQKPTPRTIAIIGLGYVGLPLALTFGRQYPTIGFDINPTRINELQQKLDSSGECTLQDFLQAPLAHFSNDPKHLAQATIYLIAVPTPITHDKLPDLSYLQSACELVGSVLKVGDIVVFESTTYPTCTRTFCVPLLESTSDLELNRDFFVGYSPERINPADKAHRLSQVVKITSGSTPESAAIIDKLYASVIPAGTHCVSSIEVAEASKALENAQRDINIAFMNEAYMLFDTLGLDMAEILQAARSKWNFLPFYPGLVGGHCISVDPYYLSYIAELKGFAPQIITSSRQTNEAMPRFIASKFVKQLESSGIELQGARVLVVGFAFKKDCKDMRNTLVPNLCDELGALGLEVEVIDSLIDKEQARLEYGISVLESSQLLAHSYDGVLCNVIHSCDSAIDFQRFCKINGVFMSISLDKA